jgi:hypothetical protein
MKNRIIITMSCLLLFTLLAFSCKTLSPSEAEKEAMKAVGFMNSGSSGDLYRMSRNPMIFETEILASEKIILALWDGLKQGGYELKNPKVLSIKEAGPESYKSFADTWEASVFFKKYLPEMSYLVRVGGDGGREILFLINGERKIKYSIIAVRVIK